MDIENNNDKVYVVSTDTDYHSLEADQIFGLLRALDGVQRVTAGPDGKAEYSVSLADARLSESQIAEVAEQVVEDHGLEPVRAQLLTEKELVDRFGVTEIEEEDVDAE